MYSVEQIPHNEHEGEVIDVWTASRAPPSVHPILRLHQIPMGPCRTLVAVALGLTLLPPSACMRWATLAPVGRSATRRAPHGPRMCGLVVVIDPSLSPEQLETYTRELTMKLVHRGPDMQDYFGCAGVGLGHTRLSIMDPNGGRQPLVSESSRSAMVHNGEIYNSRSCAHACRTSMRPRAARPTPF